MANRAGEGIHGMSDCTGTKIYWMISRFVSLFLGFQAGGVMNADLFVGGPAGIPAGEGIIPPG